MGRQSVKRLMRRRIEGECMVTVVGIGERYGGLMARWSSLDIFQFFCGGRLWGGQTRDCCIALRMTEVYINRIFISIVKSVAPVSHLLSVPSANHPR